MSVAPWEKTPDPFAPLTIMLPVTTISPITLISGDGDPDIITDPVMVRFWFRSFTYDDVRAYEEDRAVAA